MVSRTVHIAAIQPPAPGPHASRDDIVSLGLKLLEGAGRRGADIACLPEYFTVIGLPEDEWHTRAASERDRIVAETVRIGKRHQMYIILPVLDVRGEAYYNTALLLDREGRITGRYDKTHLTAIEREELGVTAGDTYPVFDLDFGRIGIMTCYDGHFPEVGRILSLNGAEILFFPSLQRHMTEDLLEVQLRARAADNCVYVVRSSYGYDASVPWTPGMMAGKTCIVDFEGTLLADAGRRVGLAMQRIDLDRPKVKERSFGGEVGDARAFMIEDRRPETYGRIGER